MINKITIIILLIFIYDKIINRDTSFLSLRSDIPFFASRSLYSNDYMRLSYNNTSIIFS